MKYFVLNFILSAFIVTSAEAAGNPTQVGLNFSSKSVLGIQGEFDISSRFDNAPVTAQVFLKNYSHNDTSLDTWNSTGIGGAVIYDFNTKYQLDKKFHPYVGAGLIYVIHTWAGIGPEKKYTGAGSGLYVTGGVKYSLTPLVTTDFSLNNFGSLTFGVSIGI